MNLFKLILITVLSLVYCQRFDVIPQVNFKISSIECRLTAEYFANITCALRPVSWERTHVNMSTNIIKPLTNLTTHFQLFRRETRFVPFLVNITRNICDVFKKIGTEFFSRTIVKLLKRFSDLPLKCPIYGYISLKNAYVDAKIFPLALPTGMYQGVFTSTEGYPAQPLGVIKINLMVEESRKPPQ